MNDGLRTRMSVLSEPRRRRVAVPVPVRMAIGTASIIGAGGSVLTLGWRFAAGLAAGVALVLVLAWVDRR